MSITHIDSVSQLNGHLSKSKDKVSVIDFHASWCGPCHAIAPTYESLSRQYKTVNFFKCDVDCCERRPTFIFLKGSSQVAQVRGADRRELESTVKRLSLGSSSSSSAFTGRGQTLGSGEPEPVDITKEAAATLNKAASKVTNLDSQFRVLLGLVAGYAVFWYLSR
ncbi:thioredoxin-domain-containing protein [Mycena filopes]|nr:thioredoxin-domain-containing protein [Mycena filopes]